MRTELLAAVALLAVVASAPAAAQTPYEEPEVIGPPGMPEDPYATQPQPQPQPQPGTTQPGWGQPQPQPQPGWGAQPQPQPQPGWGQPQPQPEKAPGAPLIDSKYGSIYVGLILQPRFRMTHVSRNDFQGYLWTAQGTSDDTDLFFEIQRARLALGGHLISEKLLYYLEMDVFQGYLDIAGGGATGEGLYPSYPSLWQQIKVGWRPLKNDKVDLSIWAGRMAPPFGILLERPVHELGAIEYPLYMMERPGLMAICPWYQTGVLLDVRMLKMLRLSFGIFNGPVVGRGDYNGDTRMESAQLNILWHDVNLQKDFFLKFAFVPEDLGIVAGLDLWLGFPPTIWDPGLVDMSGRPIVPLDKSDTMLMLGLEFGYVKPPFNIMGEFVLSYYKLHSPVNDMVAPGSRNDYAENTSTSIAFWLHFGYTIKELVEIMVRFEWFDPMLKEQMDTSISWNPWLPMADPTRDGVNDWTIRLTLGPQIRLEKLHSQINVNYLMDIYHHNDYSVATVVPPLNPMKESINNFGHTLMIQATTALW